MTGVPTSVSYHVLSSDIKHWSLSVRQGGSGFLTLGRVVTVVPTPDPLYRR